MDIMTKTPKPVEPVESWLDTTPKVEHFALQQDTTPKVGHQDEHFVLQQVENSVSVNSHFDYSRFDYSTKEVESCYSMLLIFYSFALIPNVECSNAAVLTDPNPFLIF